MARALLSNDSVNKRDVQQVSENEEMNLVERSAPSEEKKRERDHVRSRSQKCGSTGHWFCPTHQMDDGENLN
jgi:hypothetical protein